MVALVLLTITDGRYRLAASGRRFMLKASPEYLGGMILFDEAIFPYWARLEDSVLSGLPARADMFQSRAEDTERFIRAMDSLTRARGDAARRGTSDPRASARWRIWRRPRCLCCGNAAAVAIDTRRNLGLRLPRGRASSTAERESDLIARIDLVEVDYLQMPPRGRSTQSSCRISSTARMKPTTSS